MGYDTLHIPNQYNVSADLWPSFLIFCSLDRGERRDILCRGTDHGRGGAFSGRQGVKVRSMAVFAFNDPVIGRQIVFHVFVVAFFAAASLLALVFDFEGFPLVDIAKTVKIVSKTFPVNPKIRRDHKKSDALEQGD